MAKVDNGKRMSVSLPKEAAESLEWLAKERGITLSEALRHAVATEDYIQKELRDGSKILIQKADKTLREVVFR